METVSIIIPVYNKEESLQDCIDSLLVQTHENLQIILIDDGSTDGSGAVCDAYADNDRRIIVLHKKNGGVSSARNLGIDNATGKYLLFVDADDKAADDYVANYLDSAEKENAVLVIGGITIIENGIEERIYGPHEVISQKEYLRRLCQGRESQFGYVFGKMYERDLIERFHLRFDEEMTSQEDQDFVLSVLEHVSSVTCIEDCGYLYEKKPNQRVLPIKHMIQNRSKLHRIAEVVGVPQEDLDCLTRRLQQQIYVALYYTDTEQGIYEIYNAVEDKRLLCDIKKQRRFVKIVIRMLRVHNYAGILRSFHAWKMIKNILYRRNKQ